MIYNTSPQIGVYIERNSSLTRKEKKVDVVSGLVARKEQKIDVASGLVRTSAISISYDVAIVSTCFERSWNVELWVIYMVKRLLQ